MTPDHVPDLVDDFVHGVLAEADAERVRRHCDTCPDCAAALVAARRRLALLQALPVREASEEIVTMTMEYIADHDRRRRRLPKIVLGAALGIAAAWMIALVGMQNHFQGLKATPWDLRVLGQSDLLAGSRASVRVVLRDKTRGLPVGGVPVNVTLENKSGDAVVSLARFTTDAAGSGEAAIDVPENLAGPLELVVNANFTDGAETVRRPVRVTRSWRLMLTSDKPVYQPNQTIRLRALALRRPDLKPVAGEPAVFSVVDPKGNVIFKQESKSSRYGISSADCPLADEILEGAYTVIAKVGDTESRLSVDVRKYVLPKFKVDIALDKPYYAPGDTVKVALAADYFFGQPAAGADILLEAQAPDVGKPLLHRASAKADAAGKATFSFPLAKALFGRPQDAGDVRPSVQVQVTDAAGQKQGKATNLVVTTRPLRIEVIPEGGTLVRDVVNKIHVLTTYADGRPAKTRFRFTGSLDLETNDLGVGSFDVLADGGQPFTEVLRADDGKGLTAEQRVTLPVGQAANDFLVRPDKGTYAGGDTMTLTVLAGGAEPVFIDLIKDGQTVLTRTVEVSGGRGTLAVDLPPDLFGTLQLCAYRLNDSAVAVRKVRTLYVRQASGLSVKATPDKGEYRPGETAKLTLELRGQDGKPVAGALSLAAVDEAVFHVLQQRPGMEGVFYTLDEQLLQPVYALYPWSPDLTTSLPAAGREPLEQALFARTAQQTQTGPHTLSADTYPAKVRSAEQQKDVGQERVRKGWIALAVFGAFVVYCSFWAFVRPLWVVLAVHGIVFVFLCGAAAMLFLFVGASFDGVGAMMAPGSKASDAMKADMKPMGMEPRDAKGGDGPTLRVRQQFPETLLWRPEVITDENGNATLDVPLADSITTWRLSASAVSGDGRLGAFQGGIKVFQPFFVDLNLPVSLTRGDEVSVPVVVYNYLDKPQTVELSLADAPWCERLDGPTQRVELKPREVKATSYRLRVQGVGRHSLQVTAKGDGAADAIRREIEVVPDGRRVEHTTNGTLAEPAHIGVAVPDNAIEGSAKLFVKLYPSTFSQLVEGLDGIFQQPYGCFEQTSSTTYPNVLALDYLRSTGAAAPAVEAKARQYIHLGYQRLLGFEVAGGGFDWYGRAPANVPLTAYGLMEFHDMARVHEVDPNLLTRTRRWLLSKRKADGSWGDLRTTAYVAWAVFGADPNDAEPTRAYLRAVAPETINDPYLLALVANALTALTPERSEARPYLDRLLKMKKTADSGKLVFWEQERDERTMFYGMGDSGRVEATAVAVLALLPYGLEPETVRGALGWLVQKKTANGVWGSTQATVLALKALLAGTGKPLGEGERRIDVVFNGQTRRVVIPADQAEVMKQVDLSDALTAGNHRLEIREQGGAAVAYQAALRYHVPGADATAKPEPLAVQVAYDRSELSVDETLTATATLTNRTALTAPMVILDLPIPPGFAVEEDDLAQWVREGKVAKYQLSAARSAVVYLRSLNAGQTLTLTYRLKATMPLKVSVRSARAYEYYDPSRSGSAAAARLTVTPRR